MVQELRYSWRILRNSPAFAAVIVLTMALGIGANTAVFSVVHGIMLTPLPYKDPSRLVDIFDRSLKDVNAAHAFGTYGDFEEYASHARSFDRIAFATIAGPATSMTRDGATRYVATVFASDDFFAIPGVPAARGRTFEHGDLSRICSVVLSDRFWTGSLAADPGIVGKALELNHRACTVLGVMPAQFEFYNRGTELWMLFSPVDAKPGEEHYGFSFARLKHGISIAQAQTELTALHKQIPKFAWHRDYTPVVKNLQDDFAFLAGSNLRATLAILLLAVVLVLVIACLNVANLLVARSSARAGEFAIRAALGCGRARLVRQLLIEGMLLAAMGGAAGGLIAVFLVRYFIHLSPIELPIGSHVSVDLPVLAFAALLTIGTALIFGTAPACSGSRAKLGSDLRGASRRAASFGTRHLAPALIVVETSLALILISGAGLLMRSVLKFSAAPLGFDPDGVVLSYINLPGSQYAAGTDKLRVYEELRTRLDSIPGVEASAISAGIAPFGFGGSEVEIDGRARREMADVAENSVSPDYFRVLRIGLRRGRFFSQSDDPGSAAVAIVNEKFAGEYFPGADPIGKRLRIVSQPASSIEIVGVVATEEQPDLMHEMSWRAQPVVYRPLAQKPSSFMFVEVRARGSHAGAGRAIERTIGAIDTEIPIGWVFTMSEVVGRRFLYPRFRAIVLAQFSGLALLLAAVGLYGVLSYYVAQRRRELGLRMAIGARRADIVRLIAVQAGMPLLAGVVIGMILTFALTRYLANLLFGVQPGDPVTTIVAVVALLAAALLAAAKPAVDAAAVDPMQVLRHH